MDPDRSEPYLILVDELDRPVGFSEKLAAHQNGGRLHRAYSIFLFDRDGRTLLQRRAPGKYHFGGLWTNACCSHPLKGESLLESATSRLKYELGIWAPLTEAFSFVYRAHDEKSGLIEHEFDHVLFAPFDGAPHPNPAEVDGWRWTPLNALVADVSAYPEQYTPWFRTILPRVVQLRHPYVG